MKVAIIDHKHNTIDAILTSFHVKMISTVEHLSRGKSDCLNIKLVTAEGTKRNE